MDKRILETILTDQREEFESKRNVNYCSRLEESQIDLSSPQAQVVIGVRRSGKSTLCFNAITHSGERFAYVNFDDERLNGLKGEDLNDVLEVLYKINGNITHLFIDEIQNIDEWYLFVNRLLRRNMRVVITGSNAKLLSGELATHLTGRHNPIHLYPFSFRDYCAFNKTDTHTQSTMAIANLRYAFDDYMHEGGFPELIQIHAKRRYITTLVANILKRDIEERFKIIHKEQFEQLAHHLFNVAPVIVSHAKLAKQFNISSGKTVKTYISYLKQAFLLCDIHKFSYKSEQRIANEKLYPVDVALMGNRPNAMAGENHGWRLETIVFMELLRRSDTDFSDIYYYEERTFECDFVVCQGRNVKQLIQVSFDVSNTKTLRRELNGLVAASSATKCESLLLLTDHQYQDIMHAGKNIAVRPVYQWLLEYPHL